MSPASPALPSAVRAEPPAALLLDALGTLVSLEPPAPRLAGELVSRFGIRVSEAEAAVALREEIAFYRANLGEGSDAPSLVRLRRRCAEVLRDALPPRRGLEEVDGGALTEALLAALHFTPFPDALPALRAARAAGCRLVVVSNWDVSLHEVLARVELSPLLDAVITSAEVGRRKPDPGPFQRAVTVVEVGPAEAVHVGDSVREDVEGALRAGVAPVLLWREPGDPPVQDGVPVVGSLLELPWLPAGG